MDVAGSGIMIVTSMTVVATSGAIMIGMMIMITTVMDAVAAAAVIVSAAVGNLRKRAVERPPLDISFQ